VTGVPLGCVHTLVEMSQTERALEEDADELAGEDDVDDATEPAADGDLDDLAEIAVVGDDDAVGDGDVRANGDPRDHGDTGHGAAGHGDADDGRHVPVVPRMADDGDERAAEPFVFPVILMATELDDETSASPGGDPLLARSRPGDTGTAGRDADPDVGDGAVAEAAPAGAVELRTDERTTDPTDEPDVSGDILEELRQADIDGPTVALAPQDENSTGIRRPRRAPDYDPAPFPIPIKVPRLLGRKPRVRRVTRVVRHVDPWSVFKIAVVANFVLYVILLTAGVLLWNVAYATGTVDNVERFFESFGWSEFEFNGGEIYHSAWIGGLFLVIGFTGLAVLMATLFNLITDLVGGMRFTVLEEEVVEARTSPMRRFVVRRAEPEVPVVMYDESGPIIREAVVDDSGSLPR
jgi:hypothetical protein